MLVWAVGLPAADVLIAVLPPLVITALRLSLAGGRLAYSARIGGFGLGLGALAAFGSVLAFTWGSRASVTAFPGLTAIRCTTITLSGAALVTLAAALGTSALGAPAPDWSVVGPWNGAQALGAAIVGVGVLIAQIPPRPAHR